MEDRKTSRASLISRPPRAGRNRSRSPEDDAATDIQRAGVAWPQRAGKASQSGEATWTRERGPGDLWEHA